MLDIQFIRDNPDLVKQKTKEKSFEVNIDELLKLDTKRRELLQDIEALRAKRNELTASAKGTKPGEEDIAEGKKLKEQLSTCETEFEKIDEEFSKLLNLVPNPHFDDVPIGGEDASSEIKKFGATESGATDHLDFAVSKDWVDFERGAKVAGAKFYFLKGDFALLENAVLQYALDFITKKGFTYLTVPHMVNSRTAEGTGFTPRSDKEGNEYFVDGEDLTLIGTSEAPLTGYHADEVLDEADLPLLYAGYSPCYRREAGAYGKHARGLFRVHQFNKLEMYVYSTPEKSQEMHEQILKIEEEIWQALGIPYHVINIASGDLGAPAAKKYDIEYWSKVDGAYRELTSCSNCTDFQARNLNIRYKKQGDGNLGFVHTLNGTAVSMARTLIAIIEHYQTEDGNLKIPEVLLPFMSGKTQI